MKAKWNGMDTFLVIVFAIILAAGVWFLGGRNSDQGATEDKTVSVMIELTKQSEEFTKLPKVGDSVTLGVKEKMPATVTNVEVLPAITQGKDILHGAYTEAPIPGVYTVRVTAEGKGTETPSAVEINGNALRVGAEEAIKSKDWAGFGFILSVDTW